MSFRSPRDRGASRASGRARSTWARTHASRATGGRARASDCSSGFAGERQNAPRIHSPHGRDRAVDSLLVALAARAAAARLAGPGGGRVRAGAAAAAAAARLRRRGAGAAACARRGRRRARVPAPGRRLRGVVPRRLGGGDPRAPQGAPPDVRGADVRRDGADRQGRTDRGAVHQAADVAHRAGRRRRPPVVPRPRDPLRRADRRGARARPRADGAGVLPGRLDAQPPARVHEGRLRRPDPGAHVEPGVRLELAPGAPVRGDRERDRPRAAVHAGDRDRPRRRAHDPPGRRLDEPRGAPPRLRGAARAPRLDDRRLVRLLGPLPVGRASARASSTARTSPSSPASRTRSA